MTMFLAGIDQSFRTVWTLFRRILRWVEPSTPSVAQDVDVFNRIAPARHRPDDLVHIGGVDVVIDGDDPLGVVGAAWDLGRERQHLRGMTGICLLYTSDAADE